MAATKFSKPIDTEIASLNEQIALRPLVKHLDFNVGSVAANTMFSLSNFQTQYAGLPSSATIKGVVLECMNGSVGVDFKVVWSYFSNILYVTPSVSQTGTDLHMHVLYV